jgi:hypothetical protein
MLLRPESSMGMLVFVSVGYLICHFDLKYLTKRFFLPTLATFILFTVFAIDWSHTDEFVKKIEPEIEYKIMSRRLVDIGEMKTAADSVKYEVAVNGIWFDPKTITPTFLRSILLPGADWSFSHASDVFLHMLSFYLHDLFILCFVAALLFFCIFTRGYRKYISRIIFIMIFTFVYLFFADYNGFLVAERHFFNFQLIGLLIIVTYISDAPRLLVPLGNPGFTCGFVRQIPSLIRARSFSSCPGFRDFCTQKVVCHVWHRRFSWIAVCGGGDCRRIRAVGISRLRLGGIGHDR